ncbi:hypothetical protein [Amycolatopsis taiwanensis]|uniref:hypothetical protein n=1 Tax=Amycolatopsis taiwanensis TaxID=342230 RepID=UPI0004891134|nr:hypothetical protein [Amycolatopsis taiwanensis]
MGFKIHDADGLIRKTTVTMAAAADNLHDAIDKLKNATMPSGTLGVLGDAGTAEGDLPSKYNKARDKAVENLWTDIKAIVESIRSVEKAIHEYNGADQNAIDKIIFAQGDPLAGSDSESSGVQHTKSDEKQDSGGGTTSQWSSKAHSGSGGGLTK